jgi:predicted KAP-like P-loop ATPase
MEQDRPNPKFGFSADRPIVSRAEDLLGRTSFAESLAGAISSWRGKDSLVVALYGPWGSGKSSIKNMVCEVLEADEDSPPILHFSPWEWAAQDRILQAFFDQIGVLLGQDPNPKTKELSTKWRAYASYLTFGSNVVGSLGKLAVLLGVPPSAVTIVDRALKDIGKVASSGADALAAEAAQESKSLHELKGELSHNLTEMERPIVVVMDDIDRLARDEIKLLFQLIKANADLPNLVFLLLFQRDLVEQSLNEVAPGSGAKFLEKIVQVGFDVPRVDPARLHRVLSQGLEQILGSEAMSKSEHVRFGNMFHGGLSRYFENLRDVYRFLSTLEFHAVAHRQNGVLNVNSVDLIGIECLRVFEPGVFKQLPNFKEVLTELGSRVDSNDKRAAVDGLVNPVAEGRREQVREILKSLFQPVEWMLEGYSYGSGFEEQWTRARRASVSTMFDRYFQLSIGQYDVSEADIQRVLTSTDDRGVLAGLFREFNRRGILASLLYRLEAHKEEFDLSHAPALVTALFDVGDELPFSLSPGSFGMGPEWSALRIIHWYLMREPNQAIRGRILTEASRASAGLFMPVLKTSIESDKKERQKDPSTFAVSEQDLGVLQQICVERIRVAAKDGSLSGHPKMAFILYRWREWAGEAEPKTWVADIVRTVEGTLQFLVGISGQVTSQGLGDRVASVNWQVRISDVEAFVAPEIIAARLQGVNESSLIEREQEAVRAFRQAMERRQTGKGDLGPLALDDEE